MLQGLIEMTFLTTYPENKGNYRPNASLSLLLLFTWEYYVSHLKVKRSFIMEVMDNIVFQYNTVHIKI